MRLQDGLLLGSPAHKAWPAACRCGIKLHLKRSSVKVCLYRMRQCLPRTFWPCTRRDDKSCRGKNRPSPRCFSSKTNHIITWQHVPQSDEQPALDRGAMRSSMVSAGGWQSKISSGDYTDRVHIRAQSGEYGAEPRGEVALLPIGLSRWAERTALGGR